MQKVSFPFLIKICDLPDIRGRFMVSVDSETLLVLKESVLA